jgi:hypothetical protein
LLIKFASIAKTVAFVKIVEIVKIVRHFKIVNNFQKILLDKTTEHKIEKNVTNADIL